MKFRLIVAFTILAFVTAFYACKKPDNTPSDGNVVNGFNKVSMLVYYADSMIIPGYAAMQQRLTDLHTATDNFTASPSAATQAAALTAYTEAHLQYERIAAFQFGPAETALLDLYFNFSGGLDYSFATSGELTGFSSDTASIEQNIAAGTYNLATMSRSTFYAQGFPALNYLLFAPGAISSFGTNPAARSNYIKDVVERMQALVATVATGWTSYRTEFVANTKTNTGSPIGNIVNQLAYQMDLMKGPRIGWPFGKQSNGTVFATKCEAYYAGISARLAAENLKSLKKLYTANNSGRGIADYIKALNNAQLNTDVQTQFDLAINKLTEIPDPMSAAFVNNTTTVDAAYKEMQKLLTLLKTDVASATAVQITFVDNDGD